MAVRWLPCSTTTYEAEVSDGSSQAPPSDYTVQTASFLFHLVAILKLVDCYDYQTSESRGWDKSPARAWSRHLRNEALRRLPDAATRAIRIAGIEYKTYETPVLGGHIVGYHFSGPDSGYR